MASPLPKPGEAGSLQSVGDGLDGGAHTAADLRCRGRDADQDIGHAGAGDLRASRGEVSNVMTRTPPAAMARPPGRLCQHKATAPARRRRRSCWAQLDDMRPGHSRLKPGAVLFGKPWLRADQNGLITANTFRGRDSAKRVSVQLKHHLRGSSGIGLVVRWPDLPSAAAATSPHAGRNPSCAPTTTPACAHTTVWRIG